MTHYGDKEARICFPNDSHNFLLCVLRPSVISHSAQGGRNALNEGGRGLLEGQRRG